MLKKQFNRIKQAAKRIANVLFGVYEQKKRKNFGKLSIC